MPEPKVTLVALNGSAGAFVSVPATIAARYVRIREDEAATAQGLAYKLPNDNFTATFTVGVPSSPNLPQIELGSLVAIQDGGGAVLGQPAQNTANGVSAFNYRAADNYIQLRSKTATATTVRVEEFQ